MAYNPLHKLQDNIAALRIALTYSKGSDVSDEILFALKKYSGFGGIKAVLYGTGDKEDWIKQGATEADMKLWESMQELYRLLHEHFKDKAYDNVIQSLKNSVLTAFYTPAIVPLVLYAAFKDCGISPKYIYEPAAGTGIFITEAAQAFDSINTITAVEKDLLTGKVLQAITDALQEKTTVHILPLEEAPVKDNGQYDLIVSNIPFGNFKVFDEDFSDNIFTDRIHNYFFAKGLDKTGNGGLLAYITTDAFLNTPANKPAREYLFNSTDFVALAVMPDNLMKETGGTEAPNHLLIVQKNDNKQALSPDEQLLIETTAQESESGIFHINSYIAQRPLITVGDEITIDTNQYGKPHIRIWQNGDINGIADDLKDLLLAHFSDNLKIDRFNQLQQQLDSKPVLTPAIGKPMLTYLPMPEDKSPAMQTVQLGLFDAAPEENIGRVGAYLTDKDKTLIHPATASIIGTLRTTDRPELETVVLVTAKSVTGNRYVSRLYSNAKEIPFPAYWMNGITTAKELESLSGKLQGFAHEFIYRGDPSFATFFAFKQPSSEIVTDFPRFYKNGALIIHNGKTGFLREPDKELNAGRFESFTNPDSNKDFYEKYIAVRDSYFRLSLYEQQHDEEGIAERNAFNDAYDAFTVRYGLLNLNANKKLILNDEAFGFMILSSVERKENKTYVPSDILKGRLSIEEDDFQTENVKEAMAYCLNQKGDLDISFISAVTQKNEDRVIEELGEQIYFNPKINDWETADKYLSGNVLEKLRDIEPLITPDNDNPYLQRSYEAIKAVQPEKIPFELLDFNYGERWIPLEYYNRFATGLFELETNIYYLQSVDAFKVKVKGDNAIVNTEYCVTSKDGTTMYGYTLMEHALKNTNPFFTYKEVMPDGTEIRLPDNEAVQLAFSKIENIRKAFTDWLNELPREEKDGIENLYHEKYNSFVIRQYNGSHQTFPGLDLQALGITELYSSQKDSAWRIIQEKGALIDHEVGLGKTLTMIIAAQEMKRLHIIHKPMITGIKANVPEIAATYRKAYPNARVLYPGQEDFTPAKRKRILHEIKNNNWDCVILSHEQFGAIEQSPEIIRDIAQEEIDNLDRDLDTLKSIRGSGVSKGELRGLEIRRVNLSVRLNNVLADIQKRKDEDIDFKSMGIDMLFVDESHKFKNLKFTTRHTRVAGLGNPQGSQRALNMLFAARTLQQKYNDDKGVTFLSGTPISNSLTELYLIFKYLRPRALERLGMSHFDGWAAVHARKSVDFEFSVTNEIIAKERFRHFIKVPELALFYNEITDYKTALHIRQDRPELIDVLVNIKPTEDQQAFIKNLIAFARTGNANLVGLPPLSPTEDKARMLIATNLAKKMAVDMRLVNSFLYEDDQNNKISICAANFAKIYNEGNEHKVTQIVFCDIGTPKPGQFNVYDALKIKLVNDYNIPAHEIAFIHDYPTKRRPELYRKVNAGEIRCLIASTETGGVGVNVQERLIAEHDLDIPWTPKDMEQRTGRMRRPGNRIAKAVYDNKVTRYIYATEQSLDNYKFNLLKNKQTFIVQLKDNQLQVRTIDEGALDEQNGMNFNEYIAILSGDTTLLEKAKLEKKVTALEHLKVVHYKQAARTDRELAYIKEDKNSALQTLNILKADGELYRSRLQPTKDGSKLNVLQLDGLQSAEPEAMGIHIMRLARLWQPASDERSTKIGSIYGFDAMIERINSWDKINGKTQDISYNKLYVQSLNGNIKYSYNEGHPNDNNPKLAARYFIEALDRVNSLETQYEKRVSELEQNIRQLESIKDKPFTQEKELSDLKEELAGMERKIAMNIESAKIDRAKHSGDEEEESLVVEAETKTSNDVTGAVIKPISLLPRNPYPPPDFGESYRSRGII